MPASCPGCAGEGLALPAAILAAQPHRAAETTGGGIGLDNKEWLLPEGWDCSPLAAPQALEDRCYSCGHDRSTQGWRDLGNFALAAQWLGCCASPW